MIQVIIKLDICHDKKKYHSGKVHVHSKSRSLPGCVTARVNNNK